MCLQLRDFVLTVQGSTDAMTFRPVSGNAAHSMKTIPLREISLTYAPHTGPLGWEMLPVWAGIADSHKVILTHPAFCAPIMCAGNGLVSTKRPPLRFHQILRLSPVAPVHNPSRYLPPPSTEERATTIREDLTGMTDWIRHPNMKPPYWFHKYCKEKDINVSTGSDREVLHPKQRSPSSVI